MNAPPHDPRELAGILAPPSRHLVVLDFDGVLSFIVDRPGDAVPVPGALEAIAAIAARTTVAIISGRPVTELRARLDDPPVTLAGGHGAELAHANGTTEYLIATDVVAGTLDGLEADVRHLVDDELGWLVERKDTSLAVHHRLAPPDRVAELLPRVHAILDASKDLPPGFELLSGKAVLELRPVGIDKGQALRRIVEGTPGLTPLAVGDDVTDEDAFRAALDLGGTAVLVGEEPRATAAPYRLADPAAVVTFLDALAGQEG